jgi:hypothetical protein
VRSSIGNVLCKISYTAVTPPSPPKLPSAQCQAKLFIRLDNK